MAAGVPSDSAGVLEVLRDQADSQLPIWRLGRDPDPGVTLLSAVFDLDAACLSVYPGALDTGSESRRPLLKLALAVDTIGREL